LDCRASERIDTDILVVGGGAAGVAAAVTASDQGHSVVLVERYGFCGGGAVAGMSGTVCGLYAASDSHNRMPEQVVFGFADRFVRALESRGGLAPPVKYGKTFTRVHDPLIWRETADAFLSNTPTKLIYHALAIGVHLEGGERVAGGTIWTKSGILDVRAKVTIDASGDADLVAMAGFPTYCGDHGRVQNPTMIFRLQGVDVPRFVATHGEDTIMNERVSQLIRDAHDSGAYKLPRSKIWLFPTPRPGELLCNCTRITGRDGRELNCINWQDFSEAEIEGRLQAREYARFFRDCLKGCERCFIVDTGVQVGVRQTRQAVGVRRLTNENVVMAHKQPDGIARSPWPIELHTGERPKVEWLLDDVYEIPYGCFVPERGESLLFAGRCLSADHEAVASARVTAQCFSYGHAVGHAAATVVRECMSPRQIDGRDLRKVLNRDGARLD
jgi:hypothetical protein